MDRRIIAYGIILAFALLVVAILIVRRVRGDDESTQTMKYLAIAENLIRQAEDLWQDIDKAGADKKAWVLAQMKAVVENFDKRTVGKLIDSMVAFFNEIGWK